MFFRWIYLGFQWYRKNLLGFSCRQAVGARDVIFGRPWGPGWVMLRNPNVFRILVVPHKSV